MFVFGSLFAVLVYLRLYATAQSVYVRFECYSQGFFDFLSFLSLFCERPDSLWALLETILSDEFVESRYFSKNERQNDINVNLSEKRLLNFSCGVSQFSFQCLGT